MSIVVVEVVPVVWIGRVPKGVVPVAGTPIPRRPVPLIPSILTFLTPLAVSTFIVLCAPVAR